MINTNTNAGRLELFRAVKDAIRQRAGSEQVSQFDGDRFSVDQDFQISLPGGEYTVRQPSLVDDNPKTVDNVFLNRVGADGVKEEIKFEQYSQKKLVFFNEDRLKCGVQTVIETPGGFMVTNSSSDFAI